jgi:hypothetical protein
MFFWKNPSSKIDCLDGALAIKATDKNTAGRGFFKNHFFKKQLCQSVKKSILNNIIH